MTAKTYTIHGLPDLPEGYGPELYYGVLPRDARMLCGSGWAAYVSSRHPHGSYFFVKAATPWYPEEWYDEHGDLLPDVYEHTPLGSWPQHCEPPDVIDDLRSPERETHTHRRCPVYARDANWGAADIVAYRVIERA